MSIANLKSDLLQNIKDLETRPIESFSEVKDWIKDTLMPWLGNAVDELDEMDGAIADIVEQAEDILQPETAGIFSAVIIDARAVAEELGKRLGKTPNDNLWRAKLQQLAGTCALAEQTIADITISPDDEPGDDEEDPEDEVEQITPANGNESKEGEDGTQH